MVNKEAREMAEKIGQSQKDKKLLSALKLAEYFRDTYKVELTVPILLQGKLKGFLAMGAKKSGDDFSEEDLNLLKTTSAQAAVAIEKARLYDKVKNYNEELEHEVAKRTAKIQGLQVEQKQMMLEIAHGLQTPITIIRGELEVLAGEAKNKEQIHSLEHSLERITKFIYDMLRLAKMESEGKDFKKEEFDMSELMSDLVEDYEIIAAPKEIKINSSIEAGIKYWGDKAQIEEMITNLVSNSVKYIGVDGDKEIDIRLKRSDKNIKITIKDTGIGIKKEDQDKLFTRFYRARAEEESKSRGTGLGLVITKEIVERHNGKIELDSKLGQGSKFTIKLPM
jgi:signal transduction histidine kinase